jgi:hypothetical protein
VRLAQVEQQQAEEKNLWKLAEAQQADAFQLAITMRYAKGDLAVWSPLAIDQRFETQQIFLIL